MGRIFSVFLLIAIFVGGFFLIRGEKFSLVSPIPKVFGTSNKVEIVNDWFPREKQNFLGIGKTSYKLTLGAKAALLVDYDSGDIIYEKNLKDRLPVASTVKIMTALVVFENSKLSDVFTVSGKAAKIGEDSMGLTLGEKLTVEELLYGLILPSGNDAAITLAEGVAGSEAKFVEMMNVKVKSLGLKDTKFINASGLDEDGRDQYSTAYDLATIARYTWDKYPVFREISSTVQKSIDADSAHKEFYLENQTNLLTTYPGVKGIKPGFTWEAGLCLVTYAENKQSLRFSSSTAGLDGKKLLGVILGSDDRRGEMKELLDFGFNSFGINVSHPALDQ